MSVKANDSWPTIGDAMRAQLLGRSLAGLFWLVIVLVSCITFSL